MPALNCYHVRRAVADTEKAERKLILDDEHPAALQAEITAPDFSARVYVANQPPRPVSWARFLQGGDPTIQIQLGQAPAAVVIVRVGDKPTSKQRTRIFAFVFGGTGRFLIRADCYSRGYGLRTALNLMYPRSAASHARLRAVQSKTHAATMVRSSTQASDLSDFETFGVSTLRDMMSRATGVPDDATTWGGRIGGGDSLILQRDMPFASLGELSRQIDAAHARTDYEERFKWVDYVQPITDPDLIGTLEALVVDQLQTGTPGRLQLAPPEVINWDQISGFRFHGDPRASRKNGPMTRPELRLAHYLHAPQIRQLLAGLDVDKLRAYRIHAVDDNGFPQLNWSVWRCLVGEVQHDGSTYILDEGDFFQVAADYLSELDAFIQRLPAAALLMPSAKPGEWEGGYNSRVAGNGLLLLDKQLIKPSRRVTSIELCDLLTKDRKLIHVKRHLGSSELSHLFAQGAVSAELVQDDTQFREAAHAKVKELAAGDAAYGFFDTTNLNPPDFEIVYGIIERWKNRSLAEALPFFSKVNLRGAAESLTSRGFHISLKQIDVA